MATTKKPIPIYTLAVHKGAHFEEATSIALLQALGEEFFPGVKTAKIVEWPYGGGTPDGRSAEAWEAEGYLGIGVGRGRFDEHAPIDGDRKAGKSALSLVAEYLGADEHPWMAKVIELVTDEDLHASSGVLSIATCIKMMHQQDCDPTAVMEWAIEAAATFIRHEMLFYTTVRKEFDDKAKTTTVQYKGQTRTIAWIETDTPQMAKYARAKHGGNVSVIIMRNSRGNVQILPNLSHGVRMYDVIQMLRLAEQEKKGKVVTYRWDDLRREGQVLGAEEWYFQEEGQMVFNGSLTNPDVTPTKLTLEDIVAIVKIGMSDGFEPSREKGICLKNRCDHGQCPWYDFGLGRCRSLRYIIANPKAASRGKATAAA